MTVSKLDWFEHLRGADLTHAEYRVVTMIATYSDKNGRGAYPSNTVLQADARVDRKTLRAALGSLQAKGWLVLVRPGGNQHGYRRANEWALTVPKEGNQSAPTGVESYPQGGESFPGRGGTIPHEGGEPLDPHQVIDQVIDQGGETRPASPPPTVPPKPPLRLVSNNPRPTRRSRPDRPLMDAVGGKPRRLPKDWEPTPELSRETTVAGVDTGLELRKFVNYHRGKGTEAVDWDCMWRTWMLRAVERLPKPVVHGGKPPWCGCCDEHTRQVCDEDGPLGRCPECHPLSVPEAYG